MATVHVFAELDDLSQEAALLVRARIREALAERGQAGVILAGGTTPQGCYKELARLLRPEGGASAEGASALSGIHWFFGDERWVPVEHEESNEGTARRLLLQPLGIPKGNIHSWKPGSGSPARRAWEYEQGLSRFFDSSPPDLLLLGLGEDGHTASLFPGAYTVEENRSGLPVTAELPRWAAAVYVPRLGGFRLTLTVRLLSTASRIYFLVAGSNKKDTLRRVLEGDPGLPASRLVLEQTEFLVTRDTVSSIIRI